MGELLVEAVSTFLAGMSGGVLGGIGLAISNALKQRNIQRDREHEYRMAQLQSGDDRWKSMQEFMARRDDAHARTRQSAMQWDPYVKGTDKWVRNARSMFRLVLTMSLLVSTVGMMVLLVISARNDTAMAMAFNADNEIGKLVRYGFTSMIFLTSTATVFWFGGREVAQPHEK